MIKDYLRIVWLVKEYGAGEPVASSAAIDLPAGAQLLDRIHDRRIITDDANHRNFLRTLDSRMLFLDFGLARYFEHGRLLLDHNIGWGLVWFRRHANAPATPNIRDLKT